MVAVLAGGRGSRLGGAKATALAGRRAADRPCAARRGGVRAGGRRQALDAAARLDVPVWIEPDEPFHPLTGLVGGARAAGRASRSRATSRGSRKRCWRELAEARAVASVDGEYEPFPGHYDPAQLPVLREALRGGGRAATDAGAPRAAAPGGGCGARGEREHAGGAGRRGVARRRGVSGAPDFAVIGGGIVGCSLAAFLAEAGASVVLYEREAIAAGASGRNSGVVQHPLDAALVDLYEESLEHYRTLGRGFALPADPVGLLLVSRASRTPARRRVPGAAAGVPRGRRAARAGARAGRGPASPGGWRPAAPSRPPRPRTPSHCARTRRAPRCRSARPRIPSSRTAGRPA